MVAMATMRLYLIQIECVLCRCGVTITDIALRVIRGVEDGTTQLDGLASRPTCTR